MNKNITGNVLKHMIHTEDLLLLGEDGATFALEGLKGVYDALSGKSNKNIILKGKIDGSPAFVASTNFHGLKFVALKHSWENGKIFSTAEEIAEAFEGRDNVKKLLTLLLENLDYINIPENEIWMGDFLFLNETLKEREIEGKDYLTFKPNTLMYAIPMEDPLSRQIEKADFGVAWHTMYTGESLDSVSIHFGIDISRINNVPNIYQMDADLKSVGNNVLTEKEKVQISKEFEDLEYRLSLLRNYPLNESFNKIFTYLNTYRNNIIKTNNTQFPTIEGLVAYIRNKFKEESLTKKTERGMTSTIQRGEVLVNGILDNREYFNTLLSCQKMIAEIKEQFISKLNSTSRIRTFVESSVDGIIPTSGEGYVVSDSVGNVQKMVSRLEFSRNNFSSDIIKGWTNEKREKQFQ